MLPGVFLAALLLQTLAPAPPAVQRVTVVTGVSAERAAAGGAASLWVDVVPKAGIHVYAPGAKGFDAVVLFVAPRTGMTFGKAQYPAGEPMASPGTTERVPVYTKMFRITQPVTLARTVKSGEDLLVSGAVRYQACDDRLCYPTASIPVSWIVRMR